MVYSTGETARTISPPMVLLVSCVSSDRDSTQQVSLPEAPDDILACLECYRLLTVAER